TLSGVNPASCNAYLSSPSPGVVSADDATQGDGKGMLRTAGTLPGILYSAAGTPVPTCNSTNNGGTVVVSDATSITSGSAYTSGGPNTWGVMCSYNGTTYSWLMH